MNVARPGPLTLTSTSLALVLGAAIASLGACDPGSEDCTAGQEGCVCAEEGECLSGLSCRSGVCVDPDGPDPEETDSGDSGDEPAPTTCDPKRKLAIGGAFETDVSSVVFDYADVEIHHKRDVDEFEDGCVNDMFITLAAGDGCLLQVHAQGLLTPQSRLLINEVGFMADSQCPNFPDAAEGFYVGADTLNRDGSGIDGILTIPEENTESACFSGDYTLHLAGLLTRGSTILEIYPSQITLSGDFRSTAVDNACPTFPSE